MAKPKFYLIMPLAVDLFMLAGKIDWLWRKLHELYQEQVLPMEKIVSRDKKWEEIYNQFNSFVEELYEKFEDWNSHENKETAPYFLLPFSERNKIYKNIFKDMKTNGVLYRPQIRTDFGKKFFYLSKSVNHALYVLEKYCTHNAHSLAYKVTVYDAITDYMNQIRNYEGYERKYIRELTNKKITERQKKKKKF